MKKLLSLLMCAVLVTPACASNIPQKLQNSIVELKIKFVQNVAEDDEPLKEGWGICSGTYVDDHLILSAAHCVNPPENFRITQIWVKKTDISSPAVLLKVDTKHDLSLFYTSLKGTPISLAKHVKVGQDCWVVGNPLGIEEAATRGIVSKTNLQIGKSKNLYTVIDAVVLPGNSGGGLFNSNGKLIGVVVMSTSLFGEFGASGLGIAVSLKDVKNFLP